jgi:hypothetical protein
MATIPGFTKAASFNELENRHALEVQDTSMTSGSEKPLVPSEILYGFAVRDLPSEVVIEYVAKAESGELMLVVRPRDNWAYTDFRVFYGKPPQLPERRVDSVTRARDGGSTEIVFEVDMATARAYFPVINSETNGFEPGPASLALGTQTVSLELLAAERSSLGNAEFICLR